VRSHPGYYAGGEVNDEQDRKQAALRELSEADRAYRAAFQELTSFGGLETSSFTLLLTSVERLHDVALRLRDADTRPGTVGG
jgi:hypothetical protein